jgi:hypothetical protein
MLLISWYFIDSASRGEQKRGEIKMERSSHDVIENKRSASVDPTMFMKAGVLFYACHDVDERIGG